MKNFKVGLAFLFLVFMFSCDTNSGCSRSSRVTNADINGCVIVNIRGCDVLVCKSKEGYNDYAVGFGGMVKEDCNCKFKR